MSLFFGAEKEDDKGEYLIRLIMMRMSSYLNENLRVAYLLKLLCFQELFAAFSLYAILASRASRVKLDGGIFCCAKTLQACYPFMFVGFVVLDIRFGGWY